MKSYFFLIISLLACSSYLHTIEKKLIYQSETLSPLDRLRLKIYMLEHQITDAYSAYKEQENKLDELVNKQIAIIEDRIRIHGTTRPQLAVKHAHILRINAMSGKQRLRELSDLSSVLGPQAITSRVERNAQRTLEAWENFEKLNQEIKEAEAAYSEMKKLKTEL